MEIFLSFKSNFLAFVVLESFLACKCQPPSPSFALDSQTPTSDPVCLGGELRESQFLRAPFLNHMVAREGFPCRVEKSVILNPN